jgi:hypothetical protein
MNRRAPLSVLAVWALTGCGGADGDDAAGGAQPDAALGGTAGGAGGDESGGGSPVAPEAVGLEAITILPEAPQIQPGRSRQLQAMGRYGDTTRDITAAVVWSSSDPTVATVENEGRDKGRVHVEKVGQVTISATLGEVTASLTLGKACQYPEYDLRMALGQSIPPMFWEGARTPDGQRITYKLEDVACDEDVSVVVFVLGAAWCGACSAYAMRLNAEADAFEAAGGRIVYVELQDANSEPADSDFAYGHLGNLIGDGPGIRVGDLDTRPGELFLTNNAELTGLPTVYVVRRRDMTVITTADILGDRSLVDVAMDPEADWQNPPPLPFNGNCGPADEEPGEPNDTAAQATPLALGDSIGGGVCDPAGDFYQIDEPGPWKLTLDFSAAEGDLDVYAWDTATDEPLRIAGNVVGSDGTGDHEEFVHQGPTLVRVVGFRQASTTYSLKLMTP